MSGISLRSKRPYFGLCFQSLHLFQKVELRLHPIAFPFLFLTEPEVVAQVHGSKTVISERMVSGVLGPQQQAFLYAKESTMET